MAAAAAVPSGILIWFLGSMAYAGPETGYGALLYSDIAGGNLLAAIIHFLEHPARLLGLDGTILAAFILGIFSHGMALPAMMMIYLKNRRRPFPFISLHPRTGAGKSRMDLAHCPVHLSHGSDPFSKHHRLSEDAQKARPYSLLFFGGGCWYSFSVSPCAFS